VHDEGKENGLKLFVFFCSLISIIVKVLLGLSIWIQKLKYERGQELKSADLSTVQANNAF
jgi:hypothetical protein